LSGAFAAVAVSDTLVAPRNPRAIGPAPGLRNSSAAALEVRLTATAQSGLRSVTGGKSVEQNIRSGWTLLSGVFAWVSDGLVGAIEFIIAAAIAISIHGTVVRLLRRLTVERHPLVESFLARTTSLTRFGLLVLALFIALPATPVDPETKAIVARALALATIVLTGWTAMTLVNMTADLYLRRLRVEGADSLVARRHLTQIRVLTGTVNTLVMIATLGVALMTFEPVRQFGISLFASAGVAGIIAGLAARPVLSNLFAGIQIALTQPIRINDAVVVENEYGRIEEITSTYVVVQLWDLRRLVVPLSYFIEKPFQNWTRDSTSMLGSVMLHLDYTAPVDRIRAKVEEIVKASKLWDGNAVAVQVTDMKESTIELRVLVSGRSSGDTFDLRCEIREKLIAFLQHELPNALPGALPRNRQEVTATNTNPATPDPPPTP
jgi:small-conductance mechanosensitive channel